MLDAHSVLHALSSREPVALEKLPDEHGIYALFDHTGCIRNIGVTRAAGGFKRRINAKHVTGSEGYGHKFSHAYNTGRMWRNRTAFSLQNPQDADIAKKLRTAFCRRYCKAAYHPVPAIGPGDYFAQLLDLETRVKYIASASMRKWDGLHFTAEDEPQELVDMLLDELAYSLDRRQSLERQAALFVGSASL
jgi:hypothetical protein